MRNGVYENIVLDTSLFVNPEVRGAFGQSPTEALGAFLSMAAKIKDTLFFMPPSVYEELMNFVREKDITGDLLLLVRQKPPGMHEIRFPAFLLYELIEDMRERVNRGLRIAEKAVRNPDNKEQGDIIRDMRLKYREALREGIIDSKEDVDLLLLSYELDALLVTADRGLIKWAEKLGVRWLFPDRFGDYIESAIRRYEGAR